MKANKARKIADRQRVPDVESIFRMIEVAAQRGNYSLSLKGYTISKEVTGYLRDNGYRVNHDPYKQILVISW